MNDESGRSVSASGVIVYDWPPQGRFRSLWERIDAITTDEEKCDLTSLLRLWMDETSTLVSYTDESGEWVDVEPHWGEVHKWLEQ